MSDYETVRETPLKHVTPGNGFAFLSGFMPGSNHNLPAMYAHGFEAVTVVACGVRKTFPLSQIDQAFAAYCEALRANKYDARSDALEACELLALADENGIDHRIDVMPAVEAARAAIAKAD